MCAELEAQANLHSIWSSLRVLTPTRDSSCRDCAMSFVISGVCDNLINVALQNMNAISVRKVRRGRDAKPRGSP